MGLIRNALFILLAIFMLFITIREGFSQQVTSGQIFVIMDINVTNETIKLRTIESDSPDTQLIIPNRVGYDSRIRVYARNFTQEIRGADSNNNCSALIEQLKQDGMATRNVLIEQTTALSNRMVSVCPKIEPPTCPNTTAGYEECSRNLANCFAQNELLQMTSNVARQNMTATIINIENEKSNAQLQLYFLLMVCATILGFMLYKHHYQNPLHHRQL